MNPSDLHPFDWNRILLGSAPGTFLVEVVIRTVVVYLFLLVVLRLLGKRMAGEMSILELALIIMLGAILAPAMQMFDRGILHGLLILLLVLAYYRAVTWISVRSPVFEAVTLGSQKILLKDGVLQLDVMDEERVSREQLFALLRQKGLFQLGEVKRVYLEASGHFGLYEMKPARLGLSVLPEIDPEVQKLLRHEKGTRVCHRCGTLGKESGESACPCCGSEEWRPAMLKEKQS